MEGVRNMHSLLVLVFAMFMVITCPQVVEVAYGENNIDFNYESPKYDLLGPSGQVDPKPWEIYPCTLPACTQACKNYLKDKFKSALCFDLHGHTSKKHCAYSSCAENGVRCRHREKTALLKFKAELIDDYGRLSTWGNEGDDCCEWEGVLCDNRTNRIVALDLQGPGDSFFQLTPLRGNISSSLLELVDLNYLDLSFNDFNQSQIPEFVGSLGKLQYLNLNSSNFGGSIPHSLRNLSMLQLLDLGGNWLLIDTNLDWLYGFQSLEYLDLSYVNLQQAITWLQAMNRLTSVKEIHLKSCGLSLIEGNLKLPNLEVLDVSQNKFTGRVPDLSSCLSLRRLSLNDNMFNETLAENFRYLSKVEYLNLGSNHLEGIFSEAHLFNLSNLRELDLSFNSNLSVKINSSWSPPFQLSVLKLAYCKVGPYFPKWLWNQKQVEILDISNAKIFGTIPDWFWENTLICWHLNMSFNQIHGVLPDFSSKFKLSIVDLSSNEFNGSLPRLPTTIRYFDLSRNKISGTILNFCSFRSVFGVLDLSNNLLSSEIPQDCFLNLMSLAYLNLANNNISGEIPDSTDYVCGLISLHLRNNSFTGEISRSLKNCKHMNILDLGENKFIGKIPQWLGDSMPLLGVLSLKSNKLYGVIPSSLCLLAYIQVLDISVNDISGAIPKCLKKFTMLSSRLNSDSWYGRYIVDGNGTNTFYDTIDLSSNNLTGEIPTEVTGLKGLVALNLSRNNLIGSIPRDIGQLELLNFLDLSKNNLSGGIPPTLSQLSHLGILDLSFNNLSGRIPWDTHLQTFGASTYTGNLGLCGPPLELKPCPKDEMSEKPTDAMKHEDMFITRGFYVSMEIYPCDLPACTQACKNYLKDKFKSVLCFDLHGHTSKKHCALSLAAKLRGIPAHIVIPKNAPKCKVENVVRYGGQVIWSVATLQSREEVASKVLQDTGAVLIHPYNDGRIIR
ncbi:hypothetical protein DH2020_005488 [Rehmannia glutinosa]|uniref:Leucine-rich repeat-containing N-terminal plant-type domain-containing protein n=1 Tax=Rehmannia glutinosa TaxID=99300 RepID=A0ABR0XG64_REHGL